MGVLLLPLWRARGWFLTDKEYPFSFEPSFSLEGGGPEPPFPGLTHSQNR